MYEPYVYRDVYDIQFTGWVLNTRVRVCLIRCSHADAAEPVYGAGGGGVRRKWGRSRDRVRRGFLSQLASKVKS